jgi:AhpD family alkylhydroperoxidase
MSSRIKYLRPIDETNARKLVAPVYAQAKREKFAGGPLTFHFPSPKLLAGLWSIVRESLLVGCLETSLKEIVAITVSKTNECPFCTNSHASQLRRAGNHKYAQAIIDGRDEQIQNPQIRDLVAWAKANRSPGSEILLSPPFSQQEAPEIIGTATMFHYVNRMVNIFLETPAKSRPSARPSLVQRLKRLLQRMLSFIASKIKKPKPLKPGDSLQFLPEAELPHDLEWAKSNPVVAGAFARFAAAVEEVGQASLSEQVRTLVKNKIQAWHGEDPGLSRSWVEEAIQELDETSKAAARLCLLTALASYQVDEAVVNEFRTLQPEDEKLLGATAWASFTAARRISTWLHVPAS